MFDSLDAALCIVGRDGRVVDANPRWPGEVGEDFFVWAAGTTHLQPLAARTAAAVRARVETPGAPARTVQVTGRTGPGGDRWTVVSVHPVHGHRVARAVVTVQDVTEGIGAQERLADALLDEKHLLHAVIDAIPQLVYWSDADGVHRGCNGAFADFHALDPAALPWSPGAVAPVLAELERTVREQAAPVLERPVELPDAAGRTHAMLVSVLPLPVGDGPGGRPPGVIGVAADVSQARELERQLAQASRLEAVGHLASGIAHEINTPVQFVTDNTAFLTETTAELLAALHRIETLLAAAVPGPGAPPPDADPAGAVHAALVEVRALDLPFLDAEVPAALRDCRDGLARVARIVRAMKDYAHPGSVRSDVDVNRAVETTVQVCRNEWKHVAKVHLDLAPDAGTVPGFEGELKQVLLGMVVNAAQAIGDDQRRAPRTSPGTITVSTRREGDELVVRICDDGPGIPAEIRERIFDPFFTTKEVGRGTGQGLALAHAVVVTKHRGRISVTSEPGVGTEFTLRLPLGRAAQPSG